MAYTLFMSNLYNHPTKNWKINGDSSVLNSGTILEALMEESAS